MRAATNPSLFVVCRVCGMQQRETNHWFFSEMTDVSITFHSWQPDMVHEIIDHPDSTGALCGEECCSTAMSRWIQHRSYEYARQGEAMSTAPNTDHAEEAKPEASPALTEEEVWLQKSRGVVVRGRVT